jgi:hypothetical protein
MIGFLAALTLAACQPGTQIAQLSPNERHAVDVFVAAQTGPGDPTCLPCNPVEPYPERREYLLRDVTGDGLADVLVEYTLEEGNNWTDLLAIFDRIGMRCLADQEVGGNGGPLASEALRGAPSSSARFSTPKPTPCAALRSRRAFVISS